MSIFDLLFILVVLATAATLLVAAGLALSGNRRGASSLLKGYGLFLGTYLLIVIAVSLFTRPRTFRVGEPQCFDDWCIAVEQVHHTNDQREAVYDVTLRYFNRARGRPQRERNVTVYLIDDHGRRYDPDTSPATVPFDRVVPAGESVTAARVIKTPPDAHIKGVVVAHEGGFPITWFIIGEGPFRKPPVVEVP